MNEVWYKKGWTTILFLFLFWPVGVYLMWKYRDVNKSIKILIAIFTFIMHHAIFFS